MRLGHGGHDACGDNQHGGISCFSAMVESSVCVGFFPLVFDSGIGLRSKSDQGSRVFDKLVGHVDRQPDRAVSDDLSAQNHSVYALMSRSPVSRVLGKRGASLTRISLSSI